MNMAASAAQPDLFIRIPRSYVSAPAQTMPASGDLVIHLRPASASVFLERSAAHQKTPPFASEWRGYIW
jgi:hypothetical protein